MQYNKYLLAFALLASSAFASTTVTKVNELWEKIEGNKIDSMSFSANGNDLAITNEQFDKILALKGKSEFTKEKVREIVLTSDEIFAEEIDKIAAVTGSGAALHSNFSQYNSAAILTEEKYNAIKEYETKAGKPLTKDELGAYLKDGNFPTILPPPKTKDDPAVINVASPLIKPTADDLFKLYDDGKLKSDAKLDLYELSEEQKTALQVEEMTLDKIKEILETAEEKAKKKLAAEAEAKMNKLADEIFTAIDKKDIKTVLDTDLRGADPKQIAALRKDGADLSSREKVLDILKNSVETADEKKEREEKAAKEAAEAALKALAEKIKTAIGDKKLAEVKDEELTKIGATPEQIASLRAAKDLKDVDAIVAALQIPAPKVDPAAADAVLKDLATKILAAIGGKKLTEIKDEDLIKAGATKEHIKALRAATTDLKDEDTIVAALKATAPAPGSEANTATGGPEASKDQPDSGSFYKKTWFIATVSVLALAGIGGGAYLMMSRQTEETDL